jgi:hypothetical protein
MSTTDAGPGSGRGPDHERPKQEDDVLAGAKLTWALAATVVFCLILVGVSTLLLRARVRLLRPDGSWPERELNPRRAVQGVRQHLFRDYDESHRLRDVERRALDGYGWVDRKAGTVTIPIERAYDLVLSEEGGK